MTINTEIWPKSSVADRGLQAVYSFRHIKTLTQNLIAQIDLAGQPGELTALDAANCRASFQRHRKFLNDVNGVGHGDLLDADTKRFLVDYSVTAAGAPSYASLPELNALISDVRTGFGPLALSLKDLVDLAEGRGTLAIYDNALDELQYQTFTVAELVPVRAAAVTMLSFFD